MVETGTFPLSSVPSLTFSPDRLPCEGESTVKGSVSAAVC